VSEFAKPQAATSPKIDLSFSHAWTAEILRARPLILPPRHFVYPREAEEVERGALEVLVRPGRQNTQQNPQQNAKQNAQAGEPFLATCALGFRDPSAPTGLWSAPEPEEICAVAGGYAYLIDTTAPEQFVMIRYRPVLRVLPVPSHGLLLFAGHRSILAWGRDGEAWESEKLSDEGVEITGIDDAGGVGPILRGTGWSMLTDKETPFALDLRTGRHIS
jgi:hypothetical protein